MSYYQYQLKKPNASGNISQHRDTNNPNQRQLLTNSDKSFKSDIVSEVPIPQKFVTIAPTPMNYNKPCLLREDGDQKIPLFLIKLWNIVEDPSNWEVIRWDETGMSFHIMKPYVFCDNILPFYFKHKNLNSLVRQLNMYGFRKNTPIDRSGLARAESDHDHLEFFHPFFRRDHPELLVNIKRKVPNAKPTGGITHLECGDEMPRAIGGGETIAVHARDLSAIFDELKILHERQKSMEMRIEELTKENEMLWNEMAHVRGTHLKQQQIVNKLIQFLVALVGPTTGKQPHRLGKRHMYVLEDSGAKRLCESNDGGDVAASAGGDEIRTDTAPIYSTSGVGHGQQYGQTSTKVASSPAASRHCSANSTSVSTASSMASPSLLQHHQHQSILPANASEILDRLISEIANNGVGIGLSGAQSALSKYGLGGIQIDDLSPHSTDNVNNNQQLQPYVGRIFDGISPMGQHRTPISSSSSGPIIAEVTEELEMPNVTDPNRNGGKAFIQQSEKSGTQQQIMERQPSYSNYVNDIIGTGTQQKYAKKDTQAVYQQNPTLRPQPSPYVQNPIITMSPQQQLMVVQPKNSTVAKTGTQQSPASTSFMIQDRQQQDSLVPHQKTTDIESNTLLIQSPTDDINQQEQQHALNGPQGSSSNAPISEGMVLNEAEMQDIAGLNAYLDETGNRFDSLTNSIGEHWVNDFQDIFESVDGLEGCHNDHAAAQEPLEFPFLDDSINLEKQNLA